MDVDSFIDRYFPKERSAETLRPTEQELDEIRNLTVNRGEYRSNMEWLLSKAVDRGYLLRGSPYLTEILQPYDYLGHGISAITTASYNQTISGVYASEYPQEALIYSFFRKYEVTPGLLLWGMVGDLVDPVYFMSNAVWEKRCGLGYIYVCPGDGFEKLPVSETRHTYVNRAEVKPACIIPVKFEDFKHEIFVAGNNFHVDFMLPRRIHKMIEEKKKARECA